MAKVKAIAFTSRRKAFETWLSALENGKIKQARGRLKRISRKKEASFCCLGVACDVNAKAGGMPWDDTGRKYIGNNGNLPAAMQNFMAITDAEQNRLIRLNDNDKKSFKEIAAVIRAEVMPKALARPATWRRRRA